jgi:hypothetical protein
MERLSLENSMLHQKVHKLIKANQVRHTIYIALHALGMALYTGTAIMHMQVIILLFLEFKERYYKS